MPTDLTQRIKSCQQGEGRRRGVYFTWTQSDEGCAVFTCGFQGPLDANTQPADREEREWKIPRGDFMGHWPKFCSWLHLSAREAGECCLAVHPTRKENRLGKHLASLPHSPRPSFQPISSIINVLSTVTRQLSFISSREGNYGHMV